MRGRLLGGLVVALGTAQGAQADTLRDAFTQVYATNPSLSGQRASLRATDEDSAIARAAGRPGITTQGAYNEFFKRSVNNFTAPKRALQATATLTVPLYAGGQVRNSIHAADARVDAGRDDLRTAETNIFAETVAAYMDVIRDQAIVGLNGGNVRVLETNLQASRDRFEAGDLTRTDVAQSDARLQLARSQLESARAQLEASRENYLRVVGKFPENLEPPPPLPPFPANPDDAVDVAVANNPALDSARQQSKAADYDIGTARSARLPRINGVVQGQYTDYFGTLGSAVVGNTFAQTDKTATAGVQFSVPLYQGGGPGAQVRQAQARKSVTLEQVTATERSVVANARTAYARFRASEEVIRSSQIAVTANELALEGTRAEQGVGTRNLLDVLNAEQELLNSRVTLVSARRDTYVAGFTLLATMGKAEARDLGLDGGAMYDPRAHYRHSVRQLNDWDQDPKPVPVATRTVGLVSTQPAVAPAPEATSEGTKSPATTAPVTAPVATPTTPVAPRVTRPPN